MADKPNVILILTDDLGFGDVSCMEPRSKIRTEHIDKVAAEGLCLTDCHASSALCTPSRYALLTGRYNWRSRLKRSVLPGQSFHLIEEGRETVASLLKKQGYQTAAVGKWHLGMDWKTKNGWELPAEYMDKNADSDLMLDIVDFTAPVKNGPNDVGFDYFYGTPASLDQPPFVHMENDRAITQPTTFIGKRKLNRHDASMQFDVEYGPAEEGYDPQALCREMDAKVVSLVDEYADGDKPFFIYYACHAVHGPLVPSAEYLGKSGLNAYADFVLQVDGFVGELDAMLEKKGIRDNTVLIFTSDNGCSGIADYPRLISMGHNPSSIFRGNKGDIWEGGHRIPFVVRWPGHIAPGTHSGAVTCLVDLFATFAEITGASYADDAGEDSVSMLPVWLGEKEETRSDLVHHSALGCYSIRKGDWKMEFCPDGGNFRPTPDRDKLPRYQLYNMAGDVTERYNLYGRHPDIEHELLALCSQYVRDGRSTPGEKQGYSPNPFWPGLEFMI